jgi:large repetitive protein
MKKDLRHILIISVLLFSASFTSGQVQIISVSSTPVDCHGAYTGSITVEVSGGGPVYQYILYKGMAAVGFAETTATSHTFEGLNAGGYTVYAGDAGSGDARFVVVSQPAVLTAFVTPDPAEICPGANLQLQGHPSGGNGVYVLHEWSGTGAARLNSTNISNPLFNAGMPGSYDLTYRVVDGNGCEAQVNTLVTVFDNMSAGYTATNVTCYGGSNGSITFTGPAGGSGIYEYRVGGSAWQSSEIFSSLVAGTYELWIRDGNYPDQCSTMIGTAQINQPGLMSASITHDNVTCPGGNNGRIRIGNDATGGSGAYQYRITGFDWQDGRNFNGLVAGNYVVEIRDANEPGCVVVLAEAYTVSEPSIPVATITHTNVSCFGGNNGSISVSVPAPPSGSYQFRLNAGAWQGSGLFQNLVAGNYRIEIRNTNNPSCIMLLADAYAISQPASALGGSLLSQINVLCFGQATGSVTVEGSGGTAPYMYSIGGGPLQASGTFDNLAAGNHTITVTDNNGCTHNIPVTISQPASAVGGSILSQDNVLCFGQSTGSVTVEGSGGTAPYRYSIGGGPLQAGGTFDNLAAGNHTITVTDANDCTHNIPVTITQPASAVGGSILSQDNVLCFGQATGTVTVEGSGGTAPYRYSIGGGPLQASGTFDNLAAGNHTITVTDDNGCTHNIPVTITQPASVVGGSILSQDNVLCFGQATGSVTVGGSGGTAPYRYSIDGGPLQASGTFDNLAAGNYTVTVTDANDCTQNIPVTITQPASAVGGSILSQDNVLCFGQATGSVTVEGSGGTAPYRYSIGGGPLQASGTFDNLAAGNHTITVTDDNGCTYNIPVTITQPASAVGGTILSQDNVLCFGQATGSVTVEGSGGTAPYMYSIGGGPLQASGTFDNLAAGNHTITVTDDNGCTHDIPVTITQPASAVGGSILSQDNVLCFGQATGTVTVEGSGGTAPYRYSIGGGPLQASGTFENLAAGNHTVTVMDDNGCTFNIPVTITQPASALGGNILLQDNVLCFGQSTGSVTVEGSGGTAPYRYSIDGGPLQASGTFDNLAAGNYTVTVTDNNDCTYDIPVTITQPASAVGGSILSQDNVLCFGQSTGSVTVEGSGGTAPYMYSIGGGPLQASGTFENLAAGNHTVTVTDNNDCTHDIPVTITQPASALGGNILSQDNVLCFGQATGSVTVEGSGGTAPYRYSIGGGPLQASGTFDNLAAGNYTVTVTDANDCTQNIPVTITQPSSALGGSILSQDNVLCFGQSTGSVTVEGSGGTAPFMYSIGGGPLQASGTFDNLAAGNYTVTVTDANDCTHNIPVTITQPASALGGNILSQDNVLCFGQATGSVTVEGSGGTSPYRYSIGGGPLQASGTFDNLAAGNYTVTVTDANDCTIDIPVTITQPASAVGGSILSQDNVLCFGQSTGSVTVEGSGGTAPYRYSIGGGPLQASGTFENLAAGNHTVTVTDNNDCTYNIPVTITQPDPLTATLNKTDIGCFGINDGRIEITDAAGGSGLPEFSIDGINWQQDQSFLGLAAGNYNVSMRDGDFISCIIFLGEVTIEEPSPISVSINTVSHNLCHGLEDGSIEAMASGGNPGYSWYLYDGAVLISTLGPDYASQAIFENLPASDNYRVLVTDANGCGPVEEVVIISEPEALAISSVVSENIDCYGAGSGSITIIASGGTGQLLYSVDGETFLENGGVFGNLFAGLYDIAVIDDNGCRIDGPQVEITQPESLEAGISTTNVTCHGLADGTIEVLNPSGGSSGNYEYSIDGTSWTAVPLFENLVAASYHVWLRDAGSPDCFAELDGSPVTITQPDALANVSILFDEIDCYGLAAGVIYVSAEGGVLPYTYRLLRAGIEVGIQVSDDPVIFSGLPAGTYNVEVTEANGCHAEVSDAITISSPDELLIDSVNSVNIICTGDTNGMITILATGGTGALEYSITGGAQFGPDNLFENLVQGSYNIVVRDEKGCETTWPDAIVITDPPRIELQDSVVTDATCFGSLNGSIQVSATGGTGTLRYSLDNDSYQVAGIFSGLSAGAYTLYIKDANNCIRVYDMGRVGQPDILAVSAAVMGASCHNNGDDLQILASATGGTAPYTVSLFLGGILQESMPGIAENEVVTFEPLLSGRTDYMVVVQDAAGCMPVNSGLLNTVTPEELVIDRLDYSGFSCFGNEAFIEIPAAGGTAPYTYRLYNHLNEVIATHITDGAAIFDQLPAGTFRVSIDDSQSCGPVFTDEITILGRDEIVINFQHSQDITCHGSGDGSITLMASGGTGASEYSINAGEEYFSSGFFTGLQAGDYEIMLRDEAGCMLDAGLMRIDQPDELLFDNVIVEGIIPGTQNEYGSITIGMTGGTGAYQFSINDGADWQAEGFFGQLAAGQYTILARDENGCIADTTVQVELITDLVIRMQHEGPSCYGFDDGQISFTVEAGTPPYRVSLNGGDFTEISGVTWNSGGLTAGEYEIEIRDADEHIFRTLIHLAGPDPIQAVASVTPATCNRFSPGGIAGPDGAVELDVSGGSGDYTYQWSNGMVTRDADQLEAGDYLVTITDGRGCQAEVAISVGYENSVTVSFTAGELTVCPGTPVALDALVEPEGAIVTWSWISSDGLPIQPVASPTVNPGARTIYQAGVTDENFCYDMAEIIVDHFPLLGLSVGNDTVLLQGTTVELTAQGGEFVSYAWTPSTLLSNADGPVTTAMVVDDIEYHLYATTENGCQEHASIFIRVVLPVRPVSGFTPNGDGINDLFDIPHAADYPNIVVEVFNRAGQRVFYSRGYGDDQRWDGTYNNNGRDLPMGTYYYVITLNDVFGTRPVTGPVTILR